MLLWLEDLHWADRSTRAFVVYLARSLRSERVLVVSTYRSDELHRRHPLRPLLAELERAPATRRVELERFGRDELRTQLADITGGEPDGADARAALRRAARATRCSRRSCSPRGSMPAGAPPPTLRDALLLRTDRLCPEAQRQLRVLAIAGRADDVLLAELASTPAEQVREALREAVAANVITAGADGHAGVPPRPTPRGGLRRPAAGRACGAAPRDRPRARAARRGRPLARRRDRSPLRRGGGAARSPAHRGCAAEDAERVNAFGEAAALYDRALALWGRVSDPEQLAGCDLVDLQLKAALGELLRPRRRPRCRAARPGRGRAGSRAGPPSPRLGAGGARLDPVVDGGRRERPGDAGAGARSRRPGAQRRAGAGAVGPGAPAPAAGPLLRCRGGRRRSARDGRRGRPRVRSAPPSCTALAVRSSSAANTSAARRSCARAWTLARVGRRQRQPRHRLRELCRCAQQRRARGGRVRARRAGA